MMLLQRILSVFFFFSVLASCSDLRQTPLQTIKPAQKRVAIIGAGAAGSSTAYHLAQHARNASIPLAITVYERNDYIGGRSTTVQVYDDADLGVPVELGASIFVQVNRILADAVREFNLSTQGFGAARSGDDDAGAAKEVLGVWNGDEFVFTQQMGGVSWWEDLLGKGKLLWRYGLDPLRTMNLMKNVTGRFFDMYEEPLFPWKEGLSQAVADAGLLGATALTGSQFVNVMGIGELFANEIIQASTRVNYAQNIDLIHGLETMVCMATDGAMSVKGGNYQIFKHMLKASSATLRLSTAVTNIHKNANGSYAISSTSKATSSSPNPETYDTIILAAPYHQSNIHFTSSSSKEPRELQEPEEPKDSKPPFFTPPPSTPYVTLHVTLFTSPHPLSPLAFNLPPDAAPPTVILTTLQPREQARLGPAMNASNAGAAGFYSISVLRTATNYAVVPPRREFVYKIFSPERVSDAFLLRLLGRGDSGGDAEEVPAAAAPKIMSSTWPTPGDANGEAADKIFDAQTALTALETFHLRIRRSVEPFLPARVLGLFPAPLLAQSDAAAAGHASTEKSQPEESQPEKPQPDSSSSDSNSNSDSDSNSNSDTSLDDPITWIKRHTWQSYPYLPPRVTFDEHRLDSGAGDAGGGAGVWYTAGIESFISTMETSALMGRNIARLIADEWAAFEDNAEGASAEVDAAQV